MAATLSRARRCSTTAIPRPSRPLELADLFCRISRRKVRRLFRELWSNDDARQEQGRGERHARRARLARAGHPRHRAHARVVQDAVARWPRGRRSGSRPGRPDRIVGSPNEKGATCRSASSRPRSPPPAPRSTSARSARPPRSAASTRSGWRSTSCSSTSTRRSIRTPRTAAFPPAASRASSSRSTRWRSSRRCTTRIRLGTGICLVPQRNPVYTAKEVATVDWLSGGRLDFGVGVGWLAEEFRALGVPFERRGERCRAYLEVMQRLWCDPVSEYAGEFYDAARLPPVPEAGAAAAPADPLRRRERRRAAPRRRRRAGLVRLQPRARGARGAPRAPRRLLAGAGRTRADVQHQRLARTCARRPRPREALPRRRRRSGDPARVRGDARRPARAYSTTWPRAIVEPARSL